MPMFTSPNMPPGVPDDITDLIGRQHRTFVELDFIPALKMIDVSGLGNTSATYAEYTGVDGIIRKKRCRVRTGPLTLTVNALPGERYLLEKYRKLGTMFDLRYQIFGYTLLSVVDSGHGIDCQISSIKYGSIERNSDDPVELIVEIIVGEWL